MAPDMLWNAALTAALGLVGWVLVLESTVIGWPYVEPGPDTPAEI